MNKIRESKIGPEDMRMGTRKGASRDFRDPDIKLAALTAGWDEGLFIQKTWGNEGYGFDDEDVRQ